ncbi:uncharacterized protein [Apostichopus japonicus]
MEADHTHYGITTQINSECQTEPSLIDPCSTNCHYPNGELAKHVACDFCGVVYHLLCVGLEKQPVKGAKSRWFCQGCLKTPGLLQSTQHQLKEALRIIISLQAELAELSSPRPRNTETGNVQSDNQNNIDTPDQIRHNTYTECVSSIPTPPPHAVRPVMIIGDSILKHVYEDDFTDEIVKVNCLPGATVKDVRNALLAQREDLHTFSHIIIHVGTNDINTHNPNVNDISADFEELITSIQLVNGHRPSIYISGPCPRSDDHAPQIIDLNSHLKELTNKLDCKFLDNMASFTYADGEIDLSLYHGDGVHLNRKGTVKLINKLTIIGPICIRKKSSKMENARHMGVSNHSRNFYSQHRSNGTIHNNTSRYEHRQQRMRGFINNDHQREYHRRPNRHPRTSNSSRQDWQRECHRKENRQPVADHFNHRGCFNCGERNHVEANCRLERRIECHHCHRLGHKASHCWNR